MKLVVLWRKSVDTLKNDGFEAFAKKTILYLKKVRDLKKNRGTENYSEAPNKMFMDVLFINGCYLPHPSRYRVSHQREQLLANGVSSNEVFFEDVTLELVKRYRFFIFFRCPYTDTIGDFIALAKKYHKKVYFDVDDLVIDRKYTDKIPFIQEMNDEDKRNYDSGVERMKKTLRLCDGAITTTERLAEELKNYVPEVYINRNTASDHMVQLSNIAVYNRDVLPILLPEQAKNRGERKAIQQAAKRMEEKKASKRVSMGYFSGSITHNDDVKLILPALQRILSDYKNAELHIVGELDVPPELKPFKERIIARPFVSWTKLPELIASVDINLAPLENTIFNEAKSENKWVEAALVKVPTVASDVGAFARMMENNVTGLLCNSEDEWYAALSLLIEHPEERKRLAEQAHSFALKNAYTVFTGRGLAEFIRSRMTENLVMVLPSLQISGGVLVALRHCCFLMDAGLDVTILNDGVGEKDIVFENRKLPVVSTKQTKIHMSIDKAVATLWTTVAFLELYPNIKKRYYLVQNFEPGFYEAGSYFRVVANQTYDAPVPIKYITISKWCEKWLQEDYGQQPSFAPNGICTERFPTRKRNFNKEKVRILVEGNSDDFYKNVDESFQIVERLPEDRFEIWFMSYQGTPKPWYRVDKFLHRVPNEKVGKIYADCDILIKSSILESFSYPPLEMMATGGFVVVAPNDGNAEYLKNEENCLLYPQGDIDAAVQAIMRICEDSELRDVLYKNGIEMAHKRNWENMRKQILQLYN